MRFTKIHTAGCDYFVSEEQMHDAASFARRMLGKRHGAFGEGFILVEKCDGCDGKIRIFSQSGEDGSFCATALLAAAKFMYGVYDKKNRYSIMHQDNVYTVKLSTMRERVLCCWLDMPRIVPKPMEQLKYYHGIRGEILRACIPHPRVCVYELCGEHAVFLLESCAALRALNMHSVCRRLEEVLFYGEKIDFHFIAVSGDNSIALRTWRSCIGEVSGQGEGATLGAYAAAEYELIDSKRVMVKATEGSYCVELCGYDASLCAKCETVFVGEAV